MIDCDQHAGSGLMVASEEERRRKARRGNPDALFLAQREVFGLGRPFFGKS